MFNFRHKTDHHIYKEYNHSLSSEQLLKSVTNPNNSITLLVLYSHDDHNGKELPLRKPLDELINRTDDPLHMASLHKPHNIQMIGLEALGLVNVRISFLLISRVEDSHQRCLPFL